MSAPHSPDKNGTAERHWRTLFEMGRCLLLQANWSKEVWPYAVMAAAYMRIRCFENRLKETAYFAITGKKPNLSNNRVLGSEAMHISRIRRNGIPGAQRGFLWGIIRGALLISYVSQRQARFLSTGWWNSQEKRWNSKPKQRVHWVRMISCPCDAILTLIFVVHLISTSPKRVRMNLLRELRQGMKPILLQRLCHRNGSGWSGANKYRLLLKKFYFSSNLPRGKRFTWV